MHHRTEYSECGRCGKTSGPVDNDLENADDDTGLPPGWVVGTFTRVIVNPDYKPIRPFAERMADADIPIDAPASARKIVEDQMRLAMSLEEQIAEPMFITEQVFTHRCSDCINDEVFSIDRDAFISEGWLDEDDEPSEEAPTDE